MHNKIRDAILELIESSELDRHLLQVLLINLEKYIEDREYRLIQYSIKVQGLNATIESLTKRLKKNKPSAL
jgi:hypothetical protein